MTHLDHANADIVRSDLIRLVISAVTEMERYDEHTNEWDLENQLDAMTTDELWATAAGYDLL